MSKALHATYLIIILVLVAVIAFGYYHYHNQKIQAESFNGAQMMYHQNMGHTTSGSSRQMPPMIMAQSSPPPLSDQQNQQITLGTSKSTTQKTFNITGSNFYFVPNKITVNQGDKVTFVFTNAGGMHDLVIDELGVKMPLSKTGQTEEATFTASKNGSFTYYCSFPGHRQKGMWGTLVVQ